VIPKLASGALRLGRASLIVAVVTTQVACKAGVSAAPQRQQDQRRTIRVADPGYPDGTNEHLSLVGLAKRYSQLMPNANVELSPVRGAVSIVNALQNGDADVGLASVDVTYLAFHGLLEGTPTPFDNLRGIALLQVTTIQVLVNPNSTIQGVGDFAGRRICVTEGSGMSVLAKPILLAFGLDPRTVRLEAVEPEQAFSRLMAGTLDAILYRNTYPSPRVTDAIRRGARLIPIMGPAVDRLRRDYPFIRLAVMPADAYPGLNKSVKTIAVDTVLLCRRELEPAVVYQLAKGFFAELPNLSILGSLRFLDLDQAPAVPIPLHDGAARYYREVELLQ